MQRVQAFFAAYVKELDLGPPRERPDAYCCLRSRLGDYQRLRSVMEVRGFDSAELVDAIQDTEAAIARLQAVAAAARDKLIKEA